MGGFSGLLGTAGGAGGSGFSKPQLAPIQSPVSPADIAASQAGAGNSLASQQALIAFLQAQNGAGRQAGILDQGDQLAQQIGANNGAGTQGAAMANQSRLNQQLGGAGGIGAQTGAIGGLQNVLAQQQATSGQLQGIANGTGPNPAQAALNQSTGQNVANQAALMAGQRGAGANVGLLARQAAQQGAATQQQAVGQGATMQAQQEMNALAQLQQQQQAMGATNQNIAGIGSGLTGQYQAGLGQQFGQGASTVGQQQAQLGQNAGIAQNQVGNQIAATGTGLSGNLQNYGQVLGAQTANNTAQVSNQGNVNAGNTTLANTTIQGNQGLVGGALNGAAAALGARGGVVAMADGGAPDMAPVAPVPVPVGAPVADPVGPQSSFGKFMQGAAQNATPMGQTPDANAGANAISKGASALVKALSNKMKGSGDSAGATAGPDVADLGEFAAMAAKGGMTRDFTGGGGVKASNPGEKAVAKGNSYANDKIKAVLSEGEMVLPRSVMQSKDPARSAADFVRKTLAKRRAS